MPPALTVQGTFPNLRWAIVVLRTAGCKENPRIIASNPRKARHAGPQKTRSAPRLGSTSGELMNVHRSDERFIVPQWKRGALPVLSIPATMQKNNTEDSNPLLPGLEALLLETPEPQRFGWVLNPHEPAYKAHTTCGGVVQSR